MYFETGQAIVEQIKIGKEKAREERLEANRNMGCDECRLGADGRVDAVAAMKAADEIVKNRKPTKPAPKPAPKPPAVTA